VYRSLLDSHTEASDNAIVAYLVKSKNFTADGARQVSKSFKDTVAFAKLMSVAHTTEERREKTGGDKGSGMNTTLNANRTVVLPPSGATRKTFTTASPTMDAEITISTHSGELTIEDLEDVYDYVGALVKRWGRVRPATTHQVESREVEPPPRPASVVASMPIMVTKQMETDLRENGYSQEQIGQMTPQQAHDNLRKGKL